jgi:hypothetical protein
MRTQKNKTCRYEWGDEVVEEVVEEVAEEVAEEVVEDNVEDNVEDVDNEKNSFSSLIALFAVSSFF